MKAAGVDKVDVGRTRRMVVPLRIGRALDGGSGVVVFLCDFVVEDLENVDEVCRPRFLF